jgi:hypothetical protein
MAQASFPAHDIEVVRGLAAKTMELALSDEYELRRKRWRDVNERRKPDRAPVWCRPAGVMSELVPYDSLSCTDGACRSVEYALRVLLFKSTIGDDEIFEPWWGVGAAWDMSTEHTWGLRTGHQSQSTDLGGFHYDPPVKTEEDFDRVTVPQFTYNHARTQESLSRMGELLGDVMPVRLQCAPPLAAHCNTYLDQLRGMEPMLNDLAFRPERVHRAMAKLTEGTLGALRAAEQSGMLTQNHYGPMQCSDPVNGAPPAGEVGLHNLWTAANSQEFQNVSPKMHDEFLLSYQRPVLQQFGAVQYGCCEDLSRKVDLILSIPNLRVFVCSAWTNLDRVIEGCAGRCTIMWRQSASDVVYPDDMAPIVAHLEQGMRKLQGHPYQVVLRELQTLAGHPDRLKEWARAAITVAEKYA